MDFTQLRSDWKHLGPQVQRHFPHVQVPDIFPHGALWDAMLDRLAHAHDLTPAEVGETLEDLWALRGAVQDQFEAA